MTAGHESRVLPLPQDETYPSIEGHVQQNISAADLGPLPSDILNKLEKHRSTRSFNSSSRSFVERDKSRLFRLLR